MTPSDLHGIFLVEDLRVDRRIPNFQVPRYIIFLGPLQKSNFLGEILIIKK